MRKSIYKIGIDLDGTLAAYQEELIRFHNKNYGTSCKLKNTKRNDCYDLLGGNMLTRALKLKKFYKQTDSLKSIKPLKGAVEAVKKLKKDGHDLFIVTSRFRGFSSGTQKWIDTTFGNGAFSKIIYSNILSSYATRLKTGKYLRQNPDFVIEDSSHAATKCADRGVSVLLLDYPWNKDAKAKGITRVRNWNEIIRKIYS
jgi:uncharacterized HAD superfamily protein